MQKKNGADLDRIIDNLLQVLLVSHKKLLRVDFSGVDGNLTRAHLGIMAMLSKGGMTASELANALMVAKPQMTHLVDQLVVTGSVERRPDPTDRRVMNLTLTEHGRNLFGEMRSMVRANVKNKLAGLTSDELGKMTQALETLRGLVARL